LENVRAHASESFGVSSLSFLLLLIFSSSFRFDEEHEKRCIALGALKQAKWNKKKRENLIL